MPTLCTTISLPYANQHLKREGPKKGDKFGITLKVRQAGRYRRACPSVTIPPFPGKAWETAVDL